MDLKDYNVIQAKLFKKYKVDKLVIDDIIKFNQICCLLSAYRESNTTYNTIKSMIKIVKAGVK